MKVLITGSEGFIAGHLRSALAARGHQITGTDRLDPDHGVDIREARDIAGIVRMTRPDVVVHTAAQVGRVFGEDDHHHTITTNALGTVNVALAAAAVGARLVYVSTSEVYGDQGEAMCWEGGPMALPHNLYGLSKRWGEEAARLYCPDGLQIIRLSMPYGPGLPAGRGRAAIINFLDQAHRRVPIPVHRGAERSWCWVGDTIAAMVAVIERGEVGVDPITGHGIYNVGRDDDPRPMVEVARIACDLVGAPYDLIELVDPPAAQTVVKRLATAKLRALGWSPQVELEDGMRRTAETMGLPVLAAPVAA